MTPVVLSAPVLKKRVERKAFAYGVSSTVATLISEYVIELLREASRDQNATFPAKM